MKKLLTLIFLSITILSGCGFYRHDEEITREDEKYRDSKTVITFFKDIDTVVEPNSIRYGSESHELEVYTPYGIGKTKGQR